MPLYDYTCPKCKKEFSKIVLIAMRDKVKCPFCDTDGVERHFEAPMLQKSTFTYSGKDTEMSSNDWKHYNTSDKAIQGQMDAEEEQAKRLGIPFVEERKYATR